MTIQVDIWAGDLHQKHIGAVHFEGWEEASKFMSARVDEGFLCNVLHTDFKAPPERESEVKEALAKAVKAELEKE